MPSFVFIRPAIDFKIVDKVISAFLAEDCDYCSNILLPSFIEIFVSGIRSSKIISKILS